MPLKPGDPDYRKRTYDTIVPGLFIRPGGRLAFYATKADKWVRLGDYPILSLADARARARGVVGAITEHKPVPVSEKTAQSLEDAAEQYIATVLPFTAKGQPKRTKKALEQLWRREILPVLGHRPAASIKHEDVIGLLSGVANRKGRNGTGSRIQSGGPHAARKAFSEIDQFFGWAAYRRIAGIITNPCAGITIKELLRGQMVNRRRSHVPSDAELRIIWQAIKATPYPFGPLVEGLLRTGARLNELAGARWGEIDRDKCCLVVPGERMKGRAPHSIMLTEPMCELLAELPHFEGGDFIFSTTEGKRPVSGFSKMKARLDRTIAAIGHVEHWQIHDIRRVVRTGLSFSRVDGKIAEIVLAHARHGIEPHYDLHTYDREKLDALQRWEKGLVEIVDRSPVPPAVNVVGMRRSA
jgi:integrase